MPSAGTHARLASVHVTFRRRRVDALSRCPSGHGQL